MDDSDKRKFLEIMNGLADIFSANLTEIGVKMRFDALKDYSIEQITEAATIVVRTRKFSSMPVPADFIAAIEGDKEDLAEIQASLVTGAISRYGSYNKPVFDDPITQEIMTNSINWGDLCASTSKEVNFKMKEFRQLYKSYNKAASGNIINAPAEIKNLVDGMTKRIE